MGHRQSRRRAISRRLGRHPTTHPETHDIDIIHSTPEAYFAGLMKRKADLPRHERDLNPWATGCYTSIVRIKQKHRQLENAIFSLEKMASVVAAQGLMAYPREPLREALRDLLFAEFHDVLPGSCIQDGEEAGAADAGPRAGDHLASESQGVLRAGQPRGQGGRGRSPDPRLHPHPFRMDGIIECEFYPLRLQLATDVHAGERCTRMGAKPPVRWNRERGNVGLDWGKRVVFRAELAPSQMNRFDCKLEVIPAKPPVMPRRRERRFASRRMSWR